MRKFIIGQLTMMSTWFGLLIILVALLLPRDYIIIVGVVMLLTDDTHLKKFFDGMRAILESWWTE